MHVFMYFLHLVPTFSPHDIIAEKGLLRCAQSKFKVLMNAHVQSTYSIYFSEKAEDRVSILCIQPLYNHFSVTNSVLAVPC